MFRILLVYFFDVEYNGEVRRMFLCFKFFVCLRKFVVIKGEGGICVVLLFYEYEGFERYCSSSFFGCFLYV